MLFIFLALVLPDSVLAAIFSDYPRLGKLLDGAQTISPVVDFVHVLVFAVLGLAAHLLMPWVPLPRVAAGLFVFVGFSELLQCWVPSREARMSDLSGGLLGLVVGIALGYLIRVQEKRRMRRSSSRR